MGVGPNQNPSGVLEKVYGYNVDPGKAAMLAQGSGEWAGHFFDFRQEPAFVHNKSYLDAINQGTSVVGFLGDGINKQYPHPDDFQIGNVNVLGVDTPQGSGLLDTRPPSAGTAANAGNTQSTGTGILSFYGLVSQFSSSHGLTVGLDFEIFGDYIHYLPYGEVAGEGGEDTTPVITGVTDGTADNRGVRVPFVADLTPTTRVFDRYKNLRRAIE